MSRKAALEVFSTFSPSMIGGALANLWIVDAGQLVAAKDICGKELECPISLEAIRDPVLLGDGNVYIHSTG